MAYFGYRPLKPLFPMMMMFSMMGTHQFAHENLFFEDGASPSNLGYSKLGVTPDPFPFGYVPADGGYNDCIMRLAVAQNNWAGESYGLFCKNCQNWSVAVRASYQALSQQASVKKQCGCEETSSTPASRTVPVVFGKPKSVFNPVTERWTDLPSNSPWLTGPIPMPIYFFP